MFLIILYIKGEIEEIFESETDLNEYIQAKKIRGNIRIEEWDTYSKSKIEEISEENQE